MITFLLIILILSIISIYVAFKEDKVDEKYTDFGTKERFSDGYYDENNKVDKIFDLLVKDFSNNPYHDKLSSLGSSYDIARFSEIIRISFTYKFENGFKFTLNNKEIRVYNRNSENISYYRLDDLYHLKFLKLILEMKEKAQHRFKEKYKGEKPKEDTKSKSTGNPRLDKINEKIILREEQLKKLKRNDPERSALENELNTYRNISKKIKSKTK